MNKIDMTKDTPNENLEQEEDILEEIPTEEIVKVPKYGTPVGGEWKPKTKLGMGVKNREIVNIDEILDQTKRIFEPEIVDILLPGLESDLLLIGQAKGKFGGGQRRVFRQTQKKTAEGNKPHFTACAVVGNRNGYVGIGHGKSKETVPARDKAIRTAKTQIKKIRRGCGSWECGCKEPHSIPFAIEGKCGSVRLKLLPAPKGKGLIVQEELKKVLALAGIKDIWCRSSGKTNKTLNLMQACIDALDKLVKIKVKDEYFAQSGLCEGAIKGPQNA